MSLSTNASTPGLLPKPELGWRVLRWLQRRLPTREFGCPGRPIYMRRTTLLRAPLLDWRLYLHEFLRGDEDVQLHDHPWHFWSLVLWGEYIEVLDPTQHGSPQNRTALGLLQDRPRWSLAYRRATHRHRVDTIGCVTLCLCSGKTRSWGFWSGRRWVPWRQFLKEKGCL